MGSFDGKVSIVTGGANGIGAATALTLARRGSSVVIADIDKGQGESRADEYRKLGLDCIFIVADVCSEADVEALIASTTETFGRLDVIHNNAAALELIGEDKQVTELDVEIWDRTFRAAARGVMLGCKHAIPAMLETDGGSIVNTSSASGFAGELNLTAYGAAKAAVSQLTRAVAAQWGKSGIRCNAVAPGMVLTENVLAIAPPEFRAVYERHSATPFLGQPQDIANIVAFLASEEARYVTGHILHADGGMLSSNPINANFRGQAEL